MASYKQSSLYKNTKYHRSALDVWQPREIPKEADDPIVEIDSVYALRPDKLAFDLYGDAGLWWVFASRNPNTIEDPIFDFTPGKKIYLPKKSTLKQSLGL